jgi:hypothetical protein
MAKASVSGRRPRKTQPATAAISRQPLSPYLFLNPLGSFSDFTAGCLRRVYNGRANTAEEFGRLKLHPINPPAAGQPWMPRCRYTVLLPAAAADEYLDPRRLLASFDASALAWKTSLVAYATFRFPSAARLHVMFEEVRAVAKHLVETRGTPAIVVQHVPAAAGSRNSPHCHLLVPVRTLGGIGDGWGVYDEVLETDQGQQLIWDTWQRVRASIRR